MAELVYVLLIVVAARAGAPLGLAVRIRACVAWRRHRLLPGVARAAASPRWRGPLSRFRSRSEPRRFCLRAASCTSTSTACPPRTLPPSAPETSLTRCAKVPRPVPGELGQVRAPPDVARPAGATLAR